MYNCLIVDDEAGARQLIRSYLDKFVSGYNIIGEAESVADAVEQIDSLRPDLVLLDIELPLGTGFDVVKRSTFQNFQIIFITAYNQYAIDAFKIAAVDYLLKPLRIQDLKDALGRFEDRISSKDVGASVKVLIENFDAGSNELKRIVLPTINGFEVIRVNSIIRCESERNYTSFYLIDGRKVLVSKTLKDFEQILTGFGFFRIHQSHLVNLSLVKKYFRGQGGEVEMSDGSVIPISRSKKDEFVNLFVG